MDLKLIESERGRYDIYSNHLENLLSDISPKLLSDNVWNREFVGSVNHFVNEHVGSRSPIVFEGVPYLPQLELKVYWAKLLSDPRMNSRSITERRRLPMAWMQKECQAFLDSLGVICIADIPHPEFPLKGSVTAVKSEHNSTLLQEFSLFEGNENRGKTTASYVKAGAIEEKKYLSNRITVLGDFHKKILIQREQFSALNKRNIVYLNDIYSENDVRFKDSQRQKDQYVNFLKFPLWIRSAVREHVLDKVEHGELAPKTLVGYIGRQKQFCLFMHERFNEPAPSMITDTLVGEDFVAWGNRKGLYGRNWYTDCLAMLSTAARKWPDLWPKISISHRASKKIQNVHYKEGLGRIGYAKEGGNRAYSQRVIDELYAAIKSLPSPTPQVFSLIVGTGMRSEDGHAILFDCLEKDPNDVDFMLLTFWQNKVKKWNVKPLHKKDQAHSALISMIKTQQSDILKKHGKPTKYLFPIFNGSHESFSHPSYTLSQIKRQCVQHNILSDSGDSLTFSWHPLRHTKGTSMAMDGHDILSIMMELGHASPDMATVYINNRLELKKRALLENGGGRFYTIDGQVDNHISELLVRKDQISATRVCGGACTMPAQLGDWCDHANACYTCKHYRADAKDLDFFKNEKGMMINLIEAQQEEILTLEEHNRSRMSEITSRRLTKNKEVYKRLDTIISAIQTDGHYHGEEQQIKKVSLEDES